MSTAAAPNTLGKLIVLTNRLQTDTLLTSIAANNWTVEAGSVHYPNRIMATDGDGIALIEDFRDTDPKDVTPRTIIRVCNRNVHAALIPGSFYAYLEKKGVISHALSSALQGVSRKWATDTYVPLTTATRMGMVNVGVPAVPYSMTSDHALAIRTITSQQWVPVYFKGLVYFVDPTDNSRFIITENRGIHKNLYFNNVRHSGATPPDYARLVDYAAAVDPAFRKVLFVPQLRQKKSRISADPYTSLRKEGLTGKLYPAKGPHETAKTEDEPTPAPAPAAIPQQLSAQRILVMLPFMNHIAVARACGVSPSWISTSLKEGKLSESFVAKFNAIVASWR
jgi:hypothetical protein